MKKTIKDFGDDRGDLKRVFVKIYNGDKQSG
jgi:hypothetical protein